ncbi:MAG: alpha/beta hydrolase [Nitratireductor sp.]|jgi:acetyl esterase/lipase|nr:alpha/beta hydrolase [Nitratireductor sp.]
MDRRRFLSLAAGGAIAAALPLPAIALAASAQTVSYGSGKLDIYTPGTAGAPVVVYVHGGAWRAGSRNQVGSMPEYFNKLGYVFISVGYSLRADVGQQAGQVGQAISWVRDNAAGFGGDASRIAVMGHSAGCHLSSLAVLSGRAPGVRALVANDTAAYDLAYLADINNGRLPILYAAPFKDRSKWQEWSPISFAGGGGGIPVLVAWSGGRDRDAISERFASALESAGHPVTRFDGSRRYNHISISKAVGRPGDPLNQAVTQFLAQSL